METGNEKLKKWGVRDLLHRLPIDPAIMLENKEANNALHRVRGRDNKTLVRAGGSFFLDSGRWATSNSYLAWI